MKRITVKQASEIFFEGNVSKELLYKEVKAKHLPHVKLSTGKILLDTDALERWWNNQLLHSLQKVEPCNIYEEAEIHTSVRQAAGLRRIEE